MVLLDKLLRRLKSKGNRVLLFSQVWNKMASRRHRVTTPRNRPA